MNLRRRVRLIAVIPILLGALSAVGAARNNTLFGVWHFNAEQSTNIAPWKGRLPHLDIRDDGDGITIICDWRRGRGSWSDTLTVVPGGPPATAVATSPIWQQNWFMGVLAKVGSEKTTTATWLEAGRKLVTNTEQVVEVSQGQATIITRRVYAVDQQGDKLTLTETRSTRRTPIELVFDRVAEKDR